MHKCEDYINMVSLSNVVLFIGISIGVDEWSQRGFVQISEPT